MERGEGKEKREERGDLVFLLLLRTWLCLPLSTCTVITCGEVR
jgi:hypothetical protein